LASVEKAKDYGKIKMETSCMHNHKHINISEVPELSIQILRMLYLNLSYLPKGVQFILNDLLSNQLWL
jgi:hypothetical protein